MTYYPSHEIFRYQKLFHAFQTLQKIVRSNNSILRVHKTQNSKFIYLTYSISLLSENFQLINLRRRYCTILICNLSCTTKLMQRHYKLSKIEKNGMNGIIIFFCKIICYLSTVSPANLSAIRGRLQRWERGMRGDFKNPSFPTLQ